MKTFINIFLLSLILCTACGNRNVSMNQTEATKTIVQETLSCPLYRLC